MAPSPRGIRGRPVGAAQPNRREAIVGVTTAGAALMIAPLPLSAQGGVQQEQHAIAMHGAPKHGSGFTAFPYVNPDAPKGGRLRLAKPDSFDSLNPFIIKGASAGELRDYVYESLLVRSADEPFSLYGHIARSLEITPDRSAITFNLDPDAQFSDGAALTAEDVAFSVTLLREKGWPFYRNYYGKIGSMVAESPHRIRFAFKEAGDREIPLILGLMPVLPKHRTKPETFDQTTLAPPLGSGPYTVSEVDPGRQITYRRNPNWWARNKPAMRGRQNFDEIVIEYIRDQSTLFEAFKAGQIDVRIEDDPNRWVNGYTFRALDDGKVLRREIGVRLPAGFTGFITNTRRRPFNDRRVRLALLSAFDAEYVNRTQFSGLYRRTESLFERSELSSAGRAADARERALLAPYPDAVTPAVMDGTYKLPTTNGLGDARAQLGEAVRHFETAGFKLEGGRMLGPDRQQVAFEFLALTAAQERLALAYGRNLERIGVRMRIRQVDKAQYWDRLKNRDFDMIQNTWGASASPGNEQSNRWGSASADNPGSLNYAGVKSPAADAMITALLAAETADDFRSAVRALDRVVRSGTYVIPLFHLPRTFIAHSAQMRYPTPAPDNATLGGIDLDTWWMDQNV